MSRNSRRRKKIVKSRLLCYFCSTYKETTIFPPSLWAQVPSYAHRTNNVCRCLCGTTPSYLADELRRVSDMPARQRLRCASALDVPVTRRSTIGDRSFSVAAARVWNSLPVDCTSAPSLLVFRRLLKTELCRRSFPDN